VFQYRVYYHIYEVERGHRIAGPTKLECASDEVAILIAKKMLNGRDLEVWQGARVVTRLQSSDKR
jgi:hypothetical protein